MLSTKNKFINPSDTFITGGTEELQKTKLSFGKDLDQNKIVHQGFKSNKKSPNKSYRYSIYKPQR